MSTEKRMRFGHVEGRGRGREYAVKKGQYFHRRGGHFGYNAASIIICGSANMPIVWVETAKDESGADSWLSVSGDKNFCYNGYEDLFEIPVYEGIASLAASQIGLYLQIDNVKLSRDRSSTVGASTLQVIRVDNVNATAATNGAVELVDVDVEQPGYKVATVRMVGKHGQYN